MTPPTPCSAVRCVPTERPSGASPNDCRNEVVRRKTGKMTRTLPAVGLSGGTSVRMHGFYRIRCVSRAPEWVMIPSKVWRCIPLSVRQEALGLHGAVATYRENMHISFGNVTGNHELERRLLRFLVEAGVHVRVLRHKDI